MRPNTKPNSVFPKYKDKYYVYMLSKPDNTIFYIGKGKNGRVNDHFCPCNLKNNSLKSNTINKFGVENIKREIISYHDNEEEAYSVEEFLIASYGVKAEGGLLVNVAKTKKDYPKSVVGFIAKNDYCKPFKYTEGQVFACYQLFYIDKLSIREVSGITKVPESYLGYILKGIKCKDLYKKYKVSALRDEYLLTVPYKTVDEIPKEVLLEVIGYYKRATSTRESTIKKFNLTPHCVRQIGESLKGRTSRIKPETKTNQNRELILEMYKNKSMSSIASELGLPKNSLVTLLKREGVYKGDTRLNTGNASDVNSDNAS